MMHPSWGQDALSCGQNDFEVRGQGERPEEGLLYCTAIKGSSLPWYYSLGAAGPPAFLLTKQIKAGPTILHSPGWGVDSWNQFIDRYHCHTVQSHSGGLINDVEAYLQG